MKKLLCIAIAAVTVIGMLSLSACGKKKSIGTPDRPVIMSSEHFAVTDDIFQYFMNYNFTNFYNNGTEYISAIGLDSEKPLREQSCTFTGKENYTWFDFFVDQTKKSVNEYLMMAEYALDNEISLDDTDKQTISDSVSDIRSSAQDEGLSYADYLLKNYGSLITDTTVQQVYELYSIALKGRTAFAASISYTDEDYEKYCSENYSDFYTVDYILLTLDSGFTDSMSESDKAAALAKTNDKATEINNEITDENSFYSAIEKYYRTKYTVVTDDDADSATGENVKTESQLTELVNSTKYTDVQFAEQDSNDKYIFSSDRRSGDHFIFADDYTGMVQIYYIVKPLSRDERESADVRLMLFTEASNGSVSGAKNQAQLALEEFKKNGATEDVFSELAGQKSEDSTRTNGGLVEGVCAGTYGDEFDGWVFDSARNAGDTQIVTGKDGCYLVYYIAKGNTAWKNKAKSDLMSRDYNSKMNEYLEKYPITENDAEIDKIPDIIKK